MKTMIKMIVRINRRTTPSTIPATAVSLNPEPTSKNTEKKCFRPKSQEEGGVALRGRGRVMWGSNNKKSFFGLKNFRAPPAQHVN